MNKTASRPKAKAETYDVNYVRNVLGELFELVGSCAKLRKEVAIAERNYRRWKKEVRKEEMAYVKEKKERERREKRGEKAGPELALIE
jgi:hypothetical protein